MGIITVTAYHPDINIFLLTGGLEVCMFFLIEAVIQPFSRMQALLYRPLIR
jgi:hypothetical protein